MMSCGKLLSKFKKLILLQLIDKLIKKLAHLVCDKIVSAYVIVLKPNLMQMLNYYPFVHYI